MQRINSERVTIEGTELEVLFNQLNIIYSLLFQAKHVLVSYIFSFFNLSSVEIVRTLPNLYNLGVWVSALALYILAISIKVTLKHNRQMIYYIFK